MIVEDDEDIRSVFKELLESDGHVVSAACDGPSGRDLIATTHPDFAFIDIGLPGLDGYQVAELLRHAPGLSDTCLVALTGYGGPEVVRRAMDAGFDEHLTKPVTLEEIARTLSRSSGQRKSKEKMS